MSDAVIGVARPRDDAPDKVTGATRYAADGYVHGLLHARPVLATEAHARIRGVDGSAALAVPGVVAVLTAADLPIASAGTDRTSEPLAREEVVFAGQPVALVVGETEAAARGRRGGGRRRLRAARGRSSTSRLRWRSGAPLARTVEETDDEAGDLESIHAGVDHGQADDPEEELSGNVLDRITREQGDVAAAFAASAAVVEGTFRTPWVYQAYLEPQVCTAWLEPSGSLVVSTSTQGSFVTQREVARAFDLPLERVRVIAEPLGGAFGGKFALVEPLAVGAALALKRPVRLVLTRSEDFQATNPASAQVTRLKIGARADGTLTGIEARMIVDRGSNAGWGVEGISSLLVAGPYNWEAHDLRGYGVQTNRFTFGAYRAPGAPTAAFALESLLDELATALGARSHRAPPEERSRRGRRRRQRQSVSRRSARGRCWSGSRSTRSGPRATPSRTDEGIGMAAGHWPGGLEPAAAVCRVELGRDDDGRDVRSRHERRQLGVRDHRRGGVRPLAGPGPGRLRRHDAPARTPGGSGGSKVTYTVGAAVVRAAESARRSARGGLRGARDRTRRPRGRRRRRRAVGAPDRSITVEELAKKALRFGGRYEPIEGHGGSAQTSRAPSVVGAISRTSASTARPARSSCSGT